MKIELGEMRNRAEIAEAELAAGKGLKHEN